MSNFFLIFTLHFNNKNLNYIFFKIKIKIKIKIIILKIYILISFPFSSSHFHYHFISLSLSLSLSLLLFLLVLLQRHFPHMNQSRIDDKYLKTSGLKWNPFPFTIFLFRCSLCLHSSFVGCIGTN